MARKKHGGPRRQSDEIENDPMRVGYGRPPLETRFKPGQSGNPKGRPRRVPTVHESLEKVLAESIELREGDQLRRVSKGNALVRTVLGRALKGDNVAVRVILQILSAAASESPRDLETEAAFTADDDAILKDFIARNIGVVPSVEEPQQKAFKLPDPSSKLSTSKP